MPSPSLLTLSQRLTSTSSLLLERSRVISLNLPPSASSTNQIVRNLTLIKSDLEILEKDFFPSRASEGQGKKKENEAERQVREMGESFDRLVEMLEEDKVGREKAKILRREKRRDPSPAPIPDPITPKLDIPAAVPKLSVEPPTPAVNPNLPFRDYPEEDEQSPGADERGMLEDQQVLMQDQDERLNLLSHSIGRQNHLSIQIGSELDHHHELLEDTDAAMDRTAARLSSARRRLDRVADDAKQHGSTITIVVLIFILLILIIVFKT